MSGYCPDCGNTMCICKDVAAQDARDKAAKDQTPEAAEKIANDVLEELAGGIKGPYGDDVWEMCVEAAARGVAFAEGRAEEVRDGAMAMELRRVMKERDEARAEAERLNGAIQVEIFMGCAREIEDRDKWRSLASMMAGALENIKPCVAMYAYQPFAKEKTGR